MPMNEYKIVNATQLDADLASIANTIKRKTSETHDYVFPEDFNNALEKMYYENNSLGLEDIMIEGKSVTIPGGYYSKDVNVEIQDGMLYANNLIISENPTVNISDDGSSLEVKYSAEGVPDFYLTPGYIGNISNNSIIKAQGEITVSLVDFFEGKDNATIVNNEDGTTTITITISAME